MVFEQLAVLNAYSVYSIFALRLVLGSVFIYHALPKLRKPAMMAKGMGWSSNSVMFLGFVELLSALVVILGAYPKIGALGMVLVMLGALYHKMFKWKVPFSAMDKAGWEFDLVILAGALVLLTSLSYGLIFPLDPSVLY